MNFRKASKIDIGLLPVDNPDNAYGAEHKTCRAVIEPHGSELWIPFVARTEKGDFQEFMDKLVEELDHRTIRFISTGSVIDNDPLDDLLQRIAPPDARHIHEAVNGFEIEEIQLEGQAVETMVGKWQPEERPNE